MQIHNEGKIKGKLDGLTKGKLTGKTEGMAETLLFLPEQRFGSLPRQTKARVLECSLRPRSDIHALPAQCRR